MGRALTSNAAPRLVDELSSRIICSCFSFFIATLFARRLALVRPFPSLARCGDESVCLRSLGVEKDMKARHEEETRLSIESLRAKRQKEGAPLNLFFCLLFLRHSSLGAALLACP